MSNDNIGNDAAGRGVVLSPHFKCHLKLVTLNEYGRYSISIGFIYTVGIYLCSVAPATIYQIYQMDNFVSGASLQSQRHINGANMNGLSFFKVVHWAV